MMKDKKQAILDICNEVLNVKSVTVKETLEQHYSGIHKPICGQKLENGYELLFGVFKDIIEYIKNSKYDINRYYIISIIQSRSNILILLRDEYIIHYMSDDSWIDIDDIPEKVHIGKVFSNENALNIASMIVVSGINAILEELDDDPFNAKSAYSYILNKICELDSDKDKEEIGVLKYIGNILNYYMKEDNNE